MLKFTGVVVLACASMFTIAHAVTAGTSAEQAIRPALSKMSQAADAHDTDAFMASFLRSPNLVFVINGEIIRGWDALHAQQLKWWHHGKSDAQYMPDGRLEFTSLGPGVELVTEPLVSRRTSSDGSVSTGKFVVTYIWKKLPQGWRIVYGHESWTKPPG